jgi:plasmid stabilization system protein ParE
MKYTVVWRPSAEDQLAEIWMQASDRQAVTDAANSIERTLRNSPETKGVEFYGDWMIVEEPLTVVFAVYPDDCRVDILHVW